MDIFVLDSTFHAISVLDSYMSVVWTERYSAAGDIVLKVADTPEMRLLLKEGTFLSIATSLEVMIIETRLAEKGVLTVTGPSLVAFLRNRIVKRSWDNKYGFCLLSGLPGQIPGHIIRHFALPGFPGGVMETGQVVSTGALEMIPNLIIGFEDTITYPVSIDYPVKHGNIYDAIKEVCDTFNFGFTLYLDNVTPTSYNLYFGTYSGKDRTSNQSVNPIVRLQPALDSLAETKELHSISGYRNVAYAFAPNVLAAVSYVGTAYANAVAQTAVGFDRRTLLVLADDIQPADVDLTTTAGQNAFRALLTQRAKDGLANNNYIRMVDGQIVPQAGFTFGVDFTLGDIVELTADSGEYSTARVTEYIRSKDDSGFSAYPTLSVL